MGYGMVFFLGGGGKSCIVYRSDDGLGVGQNW
jgi:hypothetical protein